MVFVITKVVLEMAIKNNYTALHFNLNLGLVDSSSKLSKFKSIEIQNLSLFYSQHNIAYRRRYHCFNINEVNLT